MYLCFVHVQAGICRQHEPRAIYNGEITSRLRLKNVQAPRQWIHTSIYPILLCCTGVWRARAKQEGGIEKQLARGKLVKFAVRLCILCILFGEHYSHGRSRVHQRHEFQEGEGAEKYHSPPERGQLRQVPGLPRPLKRSSGASLQRRLVME